MDPESGQQPGFLVYAAGRRISTEHGGRQGGEKGRRSGRKIKAKDKEQKLLSFLIRAIADGKEKYGLPEEERSAFTSFPDGK